MKLIISSAQLEKEFKRLTNQYNEYYWAVAWASTTSKLYDELIGYQERIQKIIVGIHFYQTHPDFIDSFRNNNNVRFIKQPDGTFHPKLYLFYNSDNKWELLSGSANFTNSAFTKNTEVTALITNGDSNSKNILKTAFKVIEKSWGVGKQFSESELEKYRITWKNHRSKINSLSGRYGGGKRKPKPIHEVPVINMSWQEFMTKVKNEKYHGIDRRIRVIEIAKDLFEKVEHFNQLKDDERKFIAGIPNKLSINGSGNWGCFGSMKGKGIFATKIIVNDLNISKALSQIPLFGQITKTQYLNYINFFTNTFSGNYIATATRLLAMKRPDTFVCFNSKNRSKMCKDLGIKQSDMNYERYWNDIIERIYDSDWWLNPMPKQTEIKVSEARAAFLDSLYYVE